MSTCAVVQYLPRVQIGHAMVHACPFDEMVEAIVIAAAFGSEPRYVVTPNIQHIALLDKDAYLRRIYSHAAFVLPDGVSILLAGRVLGYRFPERVAGVDMFQALCREAAQRGLRVFLLGGSPGSAEKAGARLCADYPELIICGTCCPPLKFENDAYQQREIEDRIRQARPHFLFVALGAPKQEYWIYEHARRLRVPITMGIGGSFEMVGGILRRAPLWLQHIGCEWLFRLLQEPRRLWKRYFIAMVQFSQVILRQRLADTSGN